jgi:hypothetical protein
MHEITTLMKTQIEFPPGYLGVEAAREYLHLTPSGMRRFVQSGLLRPYNPFQIPRFKLSDVRKLAKDLRR